MHDWTTHYQQVKNVLHAQRASIKEFLSVRKRKERPFSKKETRDTFLCICGSSVKGAFDLHADAYDLCCLCEVKGCCFSNATFNIHTMSGSCSKEKEGRKTTTYLSKHVQASLMGGFLSRLLTHPVGLILYVWGAFFEFQKEPDAAWGQVHCLALICIVYCGSLCNLMFCGVVGYLTNQITRPIIASKDVGQLFLPETISRTRSFLMDDFASANHLFKCV